MCSRNLSYIPAGVRTLLQYQNDKHKLHRFIEATAALAPHP